MVASYCHLRHSWRLAKAWSKSEPPCRARPFTSTMVMGLIGLALLQQRVDIALLRTGSRVKNWGFATIFGHLFGTCYICLVCRMDGHFKLAFVVLTRSQLEEVGGYMYMCIYRHAILLREREREREKINTTEIHMEVGVIRSTPSVGRWTATPSVGSTTSGGRPRLLNWFLLCHATE